MKLIFLDVDGVLNKATTKERIEGYIFVEDEKIRLLWRLIAATGARVVLSSTWRRGWYCKDHGLTEKSSDREDIRLFEALWNKLREHGIRLLSYTEDFGPRGLEIEKWLADWKGAPVTSFVILDDLEEYELQPYAHRLVQTAFSEGLTAEHVEKALLMLGV